MIQVTPQMRVLVAVEPADFRKGIDGLARVCREALAADPFSGTLFVFRNRRADRVKILSWDRTGYALFYKRLEAGTFRFPQGRGRSAEVDASDLMLLLEGIELASVKRHRRYRRPRS